MIVTRSPLSAEGSPCSQRAGTGAGESLTSKLQDRWTGREGLVTMQLVWAGSGKSQPPTAPKSASSRESGWHCKKTNDKHIPTKGNKLTELTKRFTPAQGRLGDQTRATVPRKPACE